MTTLDESFARCRTLHRRHGTTIYYGTFALPRVKQPYVHALLGFSCYVDDIVDEVGRGTASDRERELLELRDRFFHDLAVGYSDDPVLKAVVHTARALDIAKEPFERIFDSMAMDLTVTSYESFDDLMVYMDGSMALFAEGMIAILEPKMPEGREPAHALAIAFQLTNFLRDIGEDLDRGRVYLPQEDLERFAADPAARIVTPAWRELMRFEIERNRSWYSVADAGLDYLPRSTRLCIAAGQAMYAEILVRIERNDYDVWSRRARVPLPRKIWILTSEWRAARSA